MAEKATERLLQLVESPIKRQADSHKVPFREKTMREPMEQNQKVLKGIWSHPENRQSNFSPYHRLAFKKLKHHYSSRFASFI